MSAGPVSPWEAALLGLVEGLTEYLPISSTGHLILVAALLGRTGDPGLNAFNIVVQSGAILAVLGLYRHRVAGMIADGWRLLSAGRPGRPPLAELHGLRLAIHLGIAFLPAALLGPLADDAIERVLFHPRPVAGALAAGALAIFALEPLRRRRSAGGFDLDRLTAGRALLIGLAQCLAMVPGTSRSLATILAGIAVGLHPAAAAEFSFLLGLPTLGGATLYKAWTAGDALMASVGVVPLVVGLVVAMVSAALAIRGFVAWLTRHGLAPFAVYRLLLAGAVLLVLARG
ncbi:MAG: undecaprenyl-diphosphate phosphatase [Acidobacteria bacterium]|nr:MAG: undecaprenyl-diphosphate phosphatase [Acidobacteriota bacterium]